MKVMPDREESHFCMHVFVLYCLVLLFGAVCALNCVMVHDGTQIYVGFVG